MPLRGHGYGNCVGFYKSILFIVRNSSRHINKVFAGATQIMQPADTAVPTGCALPWLERAELELPRHHFRELACFLHRGPTTVTNVILVAPVYSIHVCRGAIDVVIRHVCHLNFYPDIRTGPHHRLFGPDGNREWPLRGGARPGAKRYRSDTKQQQQRENRLHDSSLQPQDGNRGQTGLTLFPVARSGNLEQIRIGVSPVCPGIVRRIVLSLASPILPSPVKVRASLRFLQLL
jgi:hypothetical protein